MDSPFGFQTSKVVELGLGLKADDPLENIGSYNDEMTISQVVRFFERKGISFTKTMIQNYVRIHLIPPPKDKRFYTKDHLIMLTIIDMLKSIYSLDEIKVIFRPIMNDINTFSDDVLEMSNIYQTYLTLYREALFNWAESLPSLVNRAETIAEQAKVTGEEKTKVTNFISILTLMAQGIATKQMVTALLAESRADAEETEE